MKESSSGQQQVFRTLHAACKNRKKLRESLLAHRRAARGYRKSPQKGIHILSSPRGAVLGPPSDDDPGCESS